MGIRVITEPTVTCVGRMFADRAAIQKHLEGITPHAFDVWSRDNDGQLLIETGGRTCYQSWQGGRTHRDHIRHLVEVGHHSVLEHASFTFLVSGVSRTLLAELTRHRHLSYSVLSQRYVNHDTHGLGFVLPDGLGDQARQAWEANCGTAMAKYRFIVAVLSRNTDPKLSLKQIHEKARAVLPGCAETRLQVSGNARAFLDLLPKRDSDAADPEIRRLARAFRTHLERELPDVFWSRDQK